MRLLVKRRGQFIEDHIDLKSACMADEEPRVFTGFVDVNGQFIYDKDVVQVCKDSIFPENSFVQVVWNAEAGQWCSIELEQTSDDPPRPIALSAETIEDMLEGDDTPYTPLPGTLVEPQHPEAGGIQINVNRIQHSD